MRNLIVVPARGGSKGIPKKNIYPINGKPLLEYTLDVFVRAKLNGVIVVSTDSEEIAEVARKYEEVVVIKRPDELSVDNSRTEDALLHALDVIEESTGDVFDTIITAQPTSPLRTVETIQNFVNTFEDNYKKYDAQLTFTETKADMWRKDEQGQFMRLFPEAPRRRQERESLYVENSMLYITKVQALRDTQSVMGSKVGAFVIDEIEGLDINELNDIYLTEFYLKKFDKFY